MKHIITISLLLFSFCSFGQVADSSAKLKTFDPSKWVRNPSKEIVSTDGFRRWQIGSQFMCICPTGQIYIDSTVQSKAECKHIYVAVEPTEVKVTRPPNMQIGIYIPPPTGKQDGREIVCIKCHHIRKQVIDYGEPMPFGLTMPLHLDTLKLVGGKQLTFPMGGINVDTASVKK